MPFYEYDCPECGSVESRLRGDVIMCPECGRKYAKRIWRLRINAESARHRGRWDPQVGEYVSSEADFRSKVRRGQDAQSEKLNMDVKLEMVDGRDQQALAELHREPLAQRQETIERANMARKKEASS